MVVFCKPDVAGSSPVSSTIFRKYMKVNILSVTAEDIKKLDDFYFGPGGEFEHLASLRDIECYCEEDGSEPMTQEQAEKYFAEVKVLLDDWKEKTKEMNDNEKLEFFASFITKKKKDVEEKKLIEFWKESI